MTDGTGHPEGPWPESGGARPRAARVRRGGIAVVRRGERVVPAEGSEAELVLAEQDARQDIHVHLPVTVEVVGAPHSRVVQAAVDEALRRVRHALHAHAEWS
ncbi:hypothetical protein [Streptomyces sp. NPDC047928]|uniref:hypothetical protein n=1 Tax=unclassified Streptomyces TaxID=2593676 RepID=UPI00370F9E17